MPSTSPSPGFRLRCRRSARILTGNVVQVLSELDGVDVLFCGSRGYGPARQVLLGGVSSSSCVRHAARSSWYPAHSALVAAPRPATRVPSVLNQP